MASYAPRRKKLRFPGHDYASGGAYFVTFCCAIRGDVLGQCEGAAVGLNPIGWLTDAHVRRLGHVLPGISLDTHIVMPDHVHAIVCVDGLADDRVSISRVVKATKSTIALALPDVLASHPDLVVCTPVPLFQRSFHDRLIRTPTELDAVRAYIEENPIRWHNRP